MKLLKTTLIALFFGTFANAQNVGIGETAPTAMKLQVKAPDSAVVLIHNSTASGTKVKTGLFFKTGNFYSGSVATIGSGATFRMGLFTYGGASPSGLIERLSISDGGNVGIGKTIPLEKLDVAGDLKADTILPTAIRMTPNAGEGKVLTSDAIGNATWEERSSNGSVGFGTWGDCSTNNISEYNPVADTTFTGDYPNYFGKSVCISGNYAIVGAEQETVGPNLYQGSASIYQFTNGVWTLMQKITDPTGLAFDGFGSSVAIAGNYALVGSNGRDVGANNLQGSLSTFVLSGGIWVNSQRLTDPSGVANSFFGSSVSMSGNYIIVGAPGSSNNSNLQGNACIYQLLAGSYIFMQKITDATGALNDLFGTSVSISGNNIVVGSPKLNSNAGAVCFYRLSGSWVLKNKFTGSNVGDQFGTSVSISGNCAIVGVPFAYSNSTSNQGMVKTYQLLNNIWVNMQNMQSTDVVQVNARFGTNLFISGNYAIITTFPAYDYTMQSATIYQRIGFTWNKVQYIKSPIPTSTAFNVFGSAVSIDASTKRFIIGSIYLYSSPLGNGTVSFGKLNF